jgi:hypothetical protein
MRPTVASGIAMPTSIVPTMITGVVVRIAISIRSASAI